MTAALSTRPGLVRALAAVSGAEIGLLRAVALDVVAVGDGEALDALGPEAVGVLRQVTGPISVDLQAHSTPDGGATTFLGRGSHGIAASAHLSLVAGEGAGYLRASLRIIGTHGSMLVDLLRPALDLRTASGPRHVPVGASGAEVPSGDVAGTLSAIAASARSGRHTTTSW
jgi:hypothetical protein